MREKNSLLTPNTMPLTKKGSKGFHLMSQCDEKVNMQDPTKDNELNPKQILQPTMPR